MGSFVSFSHSPLHWVTGGVRCSRRVLYIILFLFFPTFRTLEWRGVFVRACLLRDLFLAKRSTNIKELAYFSSFFFFCTNNTHTHHAHTRFKCENCFDTEFRRFYTQLYIHFPPYIGIQQTNYCVVVDSIKFPPNRFVTAASVIRTLISFPPGSVLIKSLSSLRIDSDCRI